MWRPVPLYQDSHAFKCISAHCNLRLRSTIHRYWNGFHFEVWETKFITFSLKWQGRPSFTLKDSNQRFFWSDLLVWKSCRWPHVGVPKWKRGTNSCKNTVQPISPRKSSLLKTITESSHKRSNLPTFSQWSSGWKKSWTFLSLSSTCKYFSFPWITSASCRLLGSQRYFCSCNTNYHVCFSGDADQFNFTLETSASVSDKRARERTHWSMGSGTGCQQGKTLMNNK